MSKNLHFYTTGTYFVVLAALLIEEKEFVKMQLTLERIFNFPSWYGAGFVYRALYTLSYYARFYCVTSYLTETLRKLRKFSHSYCASRYHQSFIYTSTDALVTCLKNSIKIWIKIYIKTAPTCFGVTVTPSSRSALIRAYFNTHELMPSLMMV